MEEKRQTPSQGAAGAHREQTRAITRGRASSIAAARGEPQDLW